MTDCSTEECFIRGLILIVIVTQVKKQFYFPTLSHGASVCREFERLAVRMLNESYKDAPKTAFELLKRKTETWGSSDCLKLAAAGHCEVYLCFYVLFINGEA